MIKGKLQINHTCETSKSAGYPGEIKPVTGVRLSTQRYDPLAGFTHTYIGCGKVKCPVLW
jgi:hypothetical protein